MSLPYDASNPAVSAAKEREAFLAGKALVQLHREEHPAARHHHPQVAGERLHLRPGPRRLDQRRAAPDGHRPRSRACTGRWPTSTASGDKVPHLADLKPGGKYVMYDLHRVGGTPAVLKALLDAGFLHGDCMTVTGKTLAENLAGRAERLRATAGRRHAARQADARHGPSSSSCTGNLAPEGAVAKVAGLKKRKHHRPGQGLRRRGGVLRRRFRHGKIKAGRRGRDSRRRAGRRTRHARDALGHGRADRARDSARASA